MSSLISNSAATLLAAIWLCLSNWGGVAYAAEKDPEPSGRRPNVLLICVDDLKPIAGCYGGTAKTPHLDRLAARGVLFERAYCNQAVCAPSRNALLTGLRPQTLGIYDLGTNFRKARPDAVTLPQYFKQHGWRAEALGKIFHVGHGNNEDPRSWTAPHWRANVVAYALPESRAKKGLTREEALFSNQPAANLPRGAAYEAADVPDNAYPDGAIADEAVKRLATFKAKPSEPFFLAVGFVKPHLPFCAPKKYWDLYRPDEFALPEHRTLPKGAPRYAPTNWGELRQYRDMPETGTLSAEQERTLIHGYYAATSYMDAQFGRVFDALDENKLSDNTIVVLWGDHGWHLGDHGMWCKHTNYEQAARIPLIVMAPGAVAGGRSKSLVESVDIYPTLCELTGLEAPKGLDGKSFAATLKRPTTTVEDFAIHVYPRGNRIGRAIRTDRHRLVEWKVPGAPAETAEVELYDYETDAGETVNVAAEQPVKAAELRALLAKQPEARPQIAAGASQNPAKAKAKRPEASKGEPTFPLKVSENRRYLVDQRGRPFFFHADTAWQLPKRLARDDVEAYLDDRKARGFTAILIQSFSKEVTPLPNAYGEIPFDEAENILKPNEAYWRHVDFVIEQAARRGLAVAMAPIWIRWGGDDKHGWRNQLTDENARPFGEFAGRRYARFDNLLWILGGDANPKEKTEAIRSLARGIKAQAPKQLIMVHNAPEHPSAKFFGEDDWLDINMAYSYKEVYPQILGEWTNARPVRPILLGESGYEEESNDGRGGAPWRMRRQAYQAILAGALGGHAFGQKHLWQFDDQWRKALDSLGARQMTHVKALFASHPWHLLEPDHANKLVVEGQGKLGELDYVVAARASDGSFAVAYFPTSMTVKLNRSDFDGAVKAHWYDPTDGKSQDITNFAPAASRTVSVTPPQKNSAGDPDWVLVLDASTSGTESSKGKK